MATKIYDWSPLNNYNTSHNIETIYNDSYVISTYDVLATKVIAAFTDIDGKHQNLQISASSNLRLEGVDSVSTYVGNNSGNARLYATSNDHNGVRTDNLVTQTYLSNGMVWNTLAPIAVIKSGDASHNGDAQALSIQGTDAFKTVFVNDAQFWTENGDNQLHIGTIQDNFHFEKAIFVNDLTVGQTLDVAYLAVGTDAIIQNNLTVRNNLYSCNINLWRDIENPGLDAIAQVGYGFQVNNTNQLELIKYSKFADSNNTSITKRIAVFGHNDLKINDKNDVNYLVFNDLGVFTSSSNGDQIPTGASTLWQVNPNRSLYYMENLVGIKTAAPQYELDVRGTISSSNILCQTDLQVATVNSMTINFGSDARVKNNIELKSETTCLEQINSLDIYTYILNSDLNSNVKTGFVAQQVETVMPEVISTVNLNGLSDFKVIDSVAIIATLVGAVKTLSEKIEQIGQQMNI